MHLNSRTARGLVIFPALGRFVVTSSARFSTSRVRSLVQENYARAIYNVRLDARDIHQSAHVLHSNDVVIRASTNLRRERAMTTTIITHVSLFALDERDARLLASDERANNEQGTLPPTRLVRRGENLARNEGKALAHCYR